MNENSAYGLRQQHGMFITTRVWLFILDAFRANFFHCEFAL